MMVKFALLRELPEILRKTSVQVSKIIEILVGRIQLLFQIFHI